MTGETSRLALDAAVVGRTLRDGTVTAQAEACYLDVVVDGLSLADRLPLARGLTTPLRREWLPAVQDSVLQLLGKRPADGLDSNRVLLYVCGECGDLGCGAITVAVEVAGGRITWSRFAWENGYEPADPIGDAPTVVAFEIAAYEEVLAGAYERVAAPSHRRARPPRPRVPVAVAVGVATSPGRGLARLAGRRAESRGCGA